jgi:hypothetical protein
MRFDGAVLDQADYHSHLAKMWQGYRGEWRYRLLFTPEEHSGAYLQTFYVGLGHLARVTALGLRATYQIARVGLGFAMLLTIYRFMAHFTASMRIRRIAFLLATVASGLGWIGEIIAPTSPGGVSPMSFWLLDGYVFLSLLTFPHFCLAITLLLTIFLLLLRDPEGPSLRDTVLAASLSVGLGLIHPYMLLVLDLAPILYWAVAGFRTRRMRRGLLAVTAMGVLQGPLLAYDLWVFRSQPIFGAWSEQNVTLSPPLGVYLWGYGVLLLLGAASALARKRPGTRDLSFLWVWMGLVAVLIHLPWNLQRRFLEGLQVSLGLLAGVGLVGIAGQLKSMRIRDLAPAALIGLTAIGHLYMAAGLTLAAARRERALFWPAEVTAAVDWLGEQTSWEDTVLAAPETGGLIPARIGHRVVLGHEMETVNYEEKRAAVARFYGAETSNAERWRLLETWGTEYVFYGPYERQLGGFRPTHASELVRVFHQDEVSVFKVIR